MDPQGHAGSRRVTQALAVLPALQGPAVARSGSIQMDPRPVNGNNREQNGFFLTSKKAGSGNDAEHAVLAAAVKVASEALKEQKIRPQNVLRRLADLDTIAEATAEAVHKACEDNGLDTAGSTAYAYLVINACLSWYNERMLRRQERADGADGADAGNA